MPLQAHLLKIQCPSSHWNSGHLVVCVGFVAVDTPVVVEGGIVVVGIVKLGQPYTSNLAHGLLLYRSTIIRTNRACIGFSNFVVRISFTWWTPSNLYNWKYVAFKTTMLLRDVQSNQECYNRIPFLGTVRKLNHYMVYLHGSETKICKDNCRDHVQGQQKTKQ